jgi:hypothetical protein
LEVLVDRFLNAAHFIVVFLLPVAGTLMLLSLPHIVINQLLLLLGVNVLYVAYLQPVLEVINFTPEIVDDVLVLCNVHSY